MFAITKRDYDGRFAGQQIVMIHFNSLGDGTKVRNRRVDKGKSATGQLEFIESVKLQVIVAILADDVLCDRLVLKGGNLLSFGFQLSNRASKDIDVSIDGDFKSSDELGSRVKHCLAREFEKIQLEVFDFTFKEVPSYISEDIRTFWGGYKCEFKLISKAHVTVNQPQMDILRRKAVVLRTDGSTIFKIDFSRHEYCGDKQEFNVGGYTIFGYSPRLFVAEKLRAICQQMPEYASVIHRTRQSSSRARDFVDIHAIVEHYMLDFTDVGFHNIVLSVFQKKKVPMHLLGLIEKSKEHHAIDFQSVKDTVPLTFDLREFEFYFDYVCSKVNYLKTLWNK